MTAREALTQAIHGLECERRGYEFAVGMDFAIQRLRVYMDSLPPDPPPCPWTVEQLLHVADSLQLNSDTASRNADKMLRYLVARVKEDQR